MKPNGDKPGSKPDLKTLPMPELQAKLESSPDGITQAEAQKRLTQYGPNEIEEKKTNPYLRFLTYFWGPIPWIIEGAVILSGVVRHWPDFFIILLLLLSNAVVGFWDERQAGNAIAALKAKLAVKAKVKRDGKWTDPVEREVVPGDVIRLRLGDICAGGCALAGGRPGGGGSVRVDRRIFAGRAQTQRGGVFGLDHAPGRNRSDGVTPPVRTPPSARPRNWSRRRTPSVISSVPC
jgi:H+-transporting ATPase